MNDATTAPDRRATPVAALVAALGVVAATVLVATQPPGQVDAAQFGLLVALTAALVAAAALPIALAAQQHRVTLEEAVLVAMLVTVPVGAITWLAILATVLHELRRRTSLDRLLFNAGAAALGTGSAVAVFILLEPVREGLLATLAVAALAATVAVVVQLLVLAVLFTTLGRGAFRTHLDLPGVLDLALALNLLLGVVLAAALVAEPWLAAAVVGLVVLLGTVLRGTSPA